ncbi:MAG: hypothetical protein ACE5HE_04250 [Phycisphaerae bacterium]
MERAIATPDVPEDKDPVVTGDSADNQTTNSDHRRIEAAKREILDGENTPPPPGNTTETRKDSVVPARIPKQIGPFHIRKMIATGGWARFTKPPRKAPAAALAHGGAPAGFC